MKLYRSDTLTTTPLRTHALAIAEAGLAAIDTREVIRRNVSIDDEAYVFAGERSAFADVDRLIVVGVGKCAQDAACELEAILGERISAGIALDVKTHCILRHIDVYQGTHPFPSEANVTFTKKMIELLESAGERDLVLFVISGGGSTLLCQPNTHTCEDERTVLSCLFTAGATIREVNIIRKHISRARGGFLAKYAYPARAVSLIFSDVPDNDMQFIASGPTVRDETSITEASAVIDTFNLKEACGITHDMLFDTPQEEKYFARVSNKIVVSNEVALKAMEKEARARGFSARVCSSCLSGEAREKGSEIAREIAVSEPATALLYGGETIVMVRGEGVGGRNQELALGALKEVGDDTLVLALASDGKDAETKHAGAIADSETRTHATSLNLDLEEALAHNNSYTFFKQTGGGIPASETGSNVSDLIIALKK